MFDIVDNYLETVVNLVELAYENDGLNLYLLLFQALVWPILIIGITGKGNHSFISLLSGLVLLVNVMPLLMLIVYFSRSFREVFDSDRQTKIREYNK